MRPVLMTPLTPTVRAKGVSSSETFLQSSLDSSLIERMGTLSLADSLHYLSGGCLRGKSKKGLLNVVRHFDAHGAQGG